MIQMKTSLFLLVACAAMCLALPTNGRDTEGTRRTDIQLKKFVLCGYPPLARQGRVEGDVISTVNISADGSVSSISTVIGPDLLRETSNVLKDWRFEIPNGQATQFKIVFRFSLTGPETKSASRIRIVGTAPDLIEISTTPSSEKPGPNVRR